MATNNLTLPGTCEPSTKATQFSDARAQINKMEFCKSNTVARKYNNSLN